MIEVFYAPTTNVLKVTIALEELALPYVRTPVVIGKGEPLPQRLLDINPNARIPVIVDNAPGDAGAPLAIFESGAILIYLAERYGGLLPTDLRRRVAALQWLAWQLSGFGPTLGQTHHYLRATPGVLPYAIDRLMTETRRLYGVLERKLAELPFLARDYSIADIACWPWVLYHAHHLIDLNDYPHVNRWFCVIREREPLRAAMADVVVREPAPLRDEARLAAYGAPR